MCESIENKCKDRHSIDDAALEKALARAMNLCSRSEKCSSQIRRYLEGLSFASDNGRCRRECTERGTSMRRLDSEEIELILERLVEEGFVDDRRFALAYARDRVRLSKWGPVKVRNYLMHFGMDDALIGDAIARATDSGQNDNLHSLIETKLASLLRSEELSSLDYGQKRKLYAKVYRYAIGRGYGHSETMTELGTIFARQG